MSDATSERNERLKATMKQKDEQRSWRKSLLTFTKQRNEAYNGTY